MSQRELRALLADQRKDSSTRRTRSRTRPSHEMAKGTEETIAALQAQLEAARKTIDEQKGELERAKESDLQLQRQLIEAKVELETVALRAEVDMLRAVEKVREKEREQSQKWADDLRERFKAEKDALEGKIARLEAASTSRASIPTTSASPSASATSSSSATPPTTASSPASTTASGGVLSTASLSTTTLTASSTASATGAGVSTTAPPTTSTSVSTTASGASTTVTHATPTLTSVGSTDMIAKFFETQSQLLAAQVQAATLPPLVCFDGHSDDDDTEFLRWLERFEERARLAKWTEETKLCQLRLHLTKLAEQVFQMLPKEKKSSYKAAVDALKKRFRSVEIEELKGLEFHRRVQGEETIEQLGMDLQRLGRKAFPATEGKELDRLLKGRFYQALHPRWQRKLNAPRTDETFAQLFERARMLEQHEKQFAASAACRTETSTKKFRQSTQTSENRPVPTATTATTPATGQGSQRGMASPASSSKVGRLCYICHDTGHFARNCPTRSKNTKYESPGRSSNE